ncbi:MAG TPA: hypothetical protein VNL72_04665 [Gammaproteobacteria bacterium]|nr:hypothetical protein [Gammaproteobacteria bacterium]
MHISEQARRWLTAFSDDPLVHLHELDLVHRRALLVRLTEHAIRNAGFLDGRALEPTTEGAWLPLTAVREICLAFTMPRTPYFIFHSGHCGSTLLSRLLAALPGALPKREPLTLLALAIHRRELDTPIARLSAADWDVMFTAVLRALGRPISPNERTIIKPTSVCANLVEAAFDLLPDTKAILLTLDLETHLAIMLRDEATRESVREFAAAWLTDLHGLSGRRDLVLHELSDAQLAALSWVVPNLWFMRAKQRHTSRILRLNFDELLRDPTTTLATCAAFLDLPAEDERIADIVQGPLMSRYAKSPDRAYDVTMRQKELSIARRNFAGEIDAGRRWVDSLGLSVTD